MAKKVEILFTGRNDATFKMGKKMDDVIRPLVEKYGKENVTLVHGGNQKNSPVDRNVVKYGELSGLNTVSDPLDRSQKNAANIRTQQRIDNPNLIHYSFNSKGDLNLKDKYEGYWRDYYEKLGKETIGKGDVRPEGSLRFPKKKYKKDAQGKPTKELQSQSTLETSKFKSLLDKVEDDTNLERQLSGVKFAKSKDAWTKENIGFNLITEKNQPRIDHIERGTGLATGQTTYTADADEPELESTAKPQQKRITPRTFKLNKKGQIFEEKNTGAKLQRIKLEDTAGINREVYIDDTRGDFNDAGRRGGASLIRSTKTGTDVLGSTHPPKLLEETKKYSVKGTLLAPRTGVRKVTKSFEVRGYGTEGSTFDHKTKKAIPIVRNYTVNEIRKISSGSKNPPTPRQTVTNKMGITSAIEGPDRYSSRSSWSQLGNVELAKANETTVARNLRSGTSQTVEAAEMQSKINIREDAQSVKRHTYEYGQSQQQDLNKDVTNLIDRVKQVKSLQRKNKRIQRTGNKQKFIGTKSPAVKRLLNTVPDALSYDKQSATSTDVTKPKIYQKLGDTTKAGRDKQVRADIKKGPNPIGYNTSKAKAMRQNKTGIVTAKARQLKSSILAPRKGGQTRLSKYPSLWSVNKPIIKLEPTSAMVKAEYQKAQRTFGVSSSKELPLPKPKTKAVTSSVTPKKPRVQWWRLKSAPKPSKKVVTAASTRGETVAKRIQKRFETKPSSPNVEYKHRSTAKKHGSVGKGIKFTRGLGAFSLGSSILGVIRGRKEAKQMLEKHGIKRDPSVTETLQHTFLPKYARPKYYKIPDA